MSAVYYSLMSALMAVSLSITVLPSSCATTSNENEKRLFFFFYVAFGEIGVGVGGTVGRGSTGGS